jgi:hypothetical protein
MRPIAAALLLAAVAAFAGCAGRAQAKPSYSGTFTELSRQVAALPPSPQKEEIENLLDRLDNEILSQPTAGGSRLTETTIDNLTRLGEFLAPAKVELGFATGAKDWTGDGADDGVEVQLVPRDETGSAIKTPGTVDVVLLREGALGIALSRKELDHWTVMPNDLVRQWNASLFPAYVLQLPWHNGVPDAEGGILSVTFQPLFGPSFTVRKHVDIKRKAPERKEQAAPAA